MKLVHSPHDKDEIRDRIFKRYIKGIIKKVDLAYAKEQSEILTEQAKLLSHLLQKLNLNESDLAIATGRFRLIWGDFIWPLREVIIDVEKYEGRFDPSKAAEYILRARIHLQGLKKTLKLTYSEGKKK